MVGVREYDDPSPTLPGENVSQISLMGSSSVHFEFVPLEMRL
jgi:hypothetical protein